MQKRRMILVAVARPVPAPFTYALPQGFDAPLSPGQRLAVPFGNATALGFYLGEEEEAPPGTLKEIGRVLEERPALPEELLTLCRFASDYYRYPLGEVLRAALPPSLARAAPLPKPRGRGKKGARPEEGESGPAESAGDGAMAESSRPFGEGPALMPEQAEAVETLSAALEEERFGPFLLQGVTGSGKTEIYLRLIQRSLERGRGALALVPEIALTPQLVARFESRFGGRVATLHSGMTDAQRQREWTRLRSGEATIAVGVRSSLFAPVKDLGVVIVDEEHDSSFKQEERFRFNARDLAVKRAQLARCPVVLGSATPSLETVQNALLGRYRLLKLTKRVVGRPMPEVELVDMRERGDDHMSAAFPQLAGRAKVRSTELERLARARGEEYQPRARDVRGGRRVATAMLALGAGAPEGVSAMGDQLIGSNESAAPRELPLLSGRLVEELERTLDVGHQAILFLNRRGEMTYQLCLECGQSLVCDQCAVSQALHQGRLLKCHYCGAARPMVERCPGCGGALHSLGMGTERVEQEVARRFPKASICRLDRDAVTNTAELDALLASFARGEKQIMIGTQMVAKGHDFPGVTLVGVLLADLALNLPDFRAAERTFQLLAQVAGRAGRGAEPGRVLVQTFNPEAPAIAAALRHDFDGFAEQELALRKHFYYPPYCRLLAVRVDGVGHPITESAARRLAQVAAPIVRASGRKLRLIGPSPAPLSKLKGRARWQMLLKGPTPASLLPVARALEEESARLTGPVRASLDFDPFSML